MCNSRPRQRQELERYGLESSSATCLEQGDGHSEPEAECQSGESQCIHYCSSPEPKTKPWRPPGGEGNQQKILASCISPQEEEKACELDGLDHVSWVKLSVEDSSSISKHCPDQNSLALCPRCICQLQYHGHMIVFVCVSESLKAQGLGSIVSCH